MEANRALGRCHAKLGRTDEADAAFQAAIAEAICVARPYHEVLARCDYIQAVLDPAGRREEQLASENEARRREPRAHRVNAVLEGGRTALHAAVERGHLAAVKLLLERGADTRREEAGLTPLAAAVYYGWPSTTAAILEAGANPMRTMRGGTHKGQTALEIAEKRYEGVDRKGFTTDHWARAILEKG